MTNHPTDKASRREASLKLDPPAKTPCRAILSEKPYQAVIITRKPKNLEIAEKLTLRMDKQILVRMILVIDICVVIVETRKSCNLSDKKMLETMNYLLIKMNAIN